LMTDHKPCTFATPAPQLFSVGGLQTMIFEGANLWVWGLSPQAYHWVWGLSPSPPLSTPLGSVLFCSWVREHKNLTDIHTAIKENWISTNNRY